MTTDRKFRVLVLEDEFLVAMELEDLLIEMGYEVVGPISRVKEALPIARGADIDLAVLDINVAGTQSFPVADILRERKIPFVFASGYGSKGLEDGYQDEKILRKPYMLSDLRQVMTELGLLIGH